MVLNQQVDQNHKQRWLSSPLLCVWLLCCRGTPLLCRTKHTHFIRENRQSGFSLFFSTLDLFLHASTAAWFQSINLALRGRNISPGVENGLCLDDPSVLDHREHRLEKMKHQLAPKCKAELFWFVFPWWKKEKCFCRLFGKEEWKELCVGGDVFFKLLQLTNLCF